MRHALGHGPARRVGTLAPLLIRNRADQVVKPCLRAAILVGDKLELRSEEHTSELQSHSDLVCRLLLEKKKNQMQRPRRTRTTNSHFHRAARATTDRSI